MLRLNPYRMNQAYAKIQQVSRTQMSFGTLNKQEIENQSLRTPLRDILPEEGMSLEGMNLNYANARGAKQLKNCMVFDSTQLKNTFYDKKSNNLPSLYWHREKDGGLTSKHFDPKKFGMITYEEREKLKATDEFSLNNSNAITGWGTDGTPKLLNSSIMCYGHNSYITPYTGSED